MSLLNQFELFKKYPYYSWSSFRRASTLGQTQAGLGQEYILLLIMLLYCLYQMLAVMVLSQHRVSSSKTVISCAPCGARRMGHAVRTWSSVCSITPHLQSRKGARPHLGMDKRNRSTPVHSN